MQKIIVYGLGRIWEDNKEFVLSNFDVIAVSDKDTQKLKKFENAGYGIVAAERDKLKDVACDFVLVMPQADDVVKDVIDNLGIPREKVKRFDMLSDRIMPQGMNIWYGQEYEDMALCMILMEKGMAWGSIKYLEIGVYDPKIINNTYYFSLRGAEGVLVDANPFIEEKCKE